MVRAYALFALFLSSAVSLAQPQYNPLALEKRVSNLEERVTAIEKSLNPLAAKPATQAETITTASGAVIKRVGNHWQYATFPVADHSHTCTSCGYTWTHDEDGGTHVCPKCGGRPPFDGVGFIANPQPLTLPSMRSVPIRTQPTRFVPMWAPIRSAAGCANGMCGR